MNIKLVTGLHLTATNKRHIAEIIEKQIFAVDENDFRVGTAAIKYAVLKTNEENRYTVIIRKKETNDWGRPLIRTSRNVIEVR